MDVWRVNKRKVAVADCLDMISRASETKEDQWSYGDSYAVYVIQIDYLYNIIYKLKVGALRTYNKASTGQCGQYKLDLCDLIRCIYLKQKRYRNIGKKTLFYYNKCIQVQTYMCVTPWQFCLSSRKKTWYSFLKLKLI